MPDDIATVVMTIQRRDGSSRTIRVPVAISQLNNDAYIDDLYDKVCADFMRLVNYWENVT